MTKARQLAEFASDHAMFRNLLYNGAMQINQRGNVSNSSGNAYGCDRWQIVRAGGVGNAVYDLKQSTDVPSGQPFKNSFHLDITTAETSIQNGGGYQFRQQLEGYDVQRLMKGTSSAKSLTLSFWVKSPKTGTHIVELYDVDNARQVSQSYTINSANTWQQVTVNFPADTTGSFDNDNNRSLLIQWWLAAGNNFTSGTLNTSWANNTDANRLVGQVNILDATNDWYITGIQLEEGTVATPFEHRPISIEKSLCYRYYYRMTANPVSVTVGGTTTTNASYIGFAVGRAYSTTAGTAIIFLPEPLRTSPPVFNYSPIVNNNWDYVITDMSLVNRQLADTRTVAIYASISVAQSQSSWLLSTGNIGSGLSSTDSVFMDFSAEL